MHLMTMTELFLLERDSSMRNTASLLSGRVFEEELVEEEVPLPPTDFTLIMKSYAAYRESNDKKNTDRKSKHFSNLCHV